MPHESAQAETAAPLTLSSTQIAVAAAGFVIAIVALKKLFFSFSSDPDENSLFNWNWFGENKAKLLYEECVAADPQNEFEQKHLLRDRVVEVMRRAAKMGEERDSLSKLHKQGLISDRMWESFSKAERDIEVEIYDIKAEAETFAAGYGDRIFQETSGAAKSREFQLDEIMQELKRRNPDLRIPNTKEGKEAFARRFLAEQRAKK